MSWFAPLFCFCFVSFLSGAPGASFQLMAATCSTSSAAAHSLIGTSTWASLPAGSSAVAGPASRLFTSRLRTLRDCSQRFPADSACSPSWHRFNQTSRTFSPLVLHHGQPKVLFIGFCPHGQLPFTCMMVLKPREFSNRVWFCYCDKP